MSVSEDMSTATAIHSTVWDVVETPIGELPVVAGPGGLRRLFFPGHARGLNERKRDARALEPVGRQLQEYFAGERRAFELDLDIEGQGDELAQRVWAELLEIPYGETTTYGELGRIVGHDDPRDIGSCVGSTPVPIVIPCHRVIGADGSLRGYLGGLDRKESLLRLEHRGIGDTSIPAWARAEQLSLG